MAHDTSRVTVVDHPLVAHKITMLRDETTPSSAFRVLCQEVTLLTAYEALRHLPVHKVPVKTPVAETESPVLSGRAPAIVGILRAGLVMVEAILTLIPHGRVGHLGLYRDPDTHQPVEYYRKLPENIDEREVLLVDPMLATGGSAAHALDILADAGVADVAVHGPGVGHERVEQRLEHTDRHRRLQTDRARRRQDVAHGVELRLRHRCRPGLVIGAHRAALS